MCVKSYNMKNDKYFSELFGTLLTFLLITVYISSARVEGAAVNSNNRNSEDPDIQTKFGGGYHHFNNYYSENRPVRPTRQTIPQPHRTQPIGVQQPSFDQTLAGTLQSIQQLQGIQETSQTGFQQQQQQGQGGWQQTGAFQPGGQQVGSQFPQQSGGQQVGSQFPQQSGGQQIGSQFPQQSGSTTQDPLEADCIRRCQTTGQYNPVCGTDSVTYSNPNRLQCAQDCNRRVRIQYYGICVTTTTTAPNFRRRT